MEPTQYNGIYFNIEVEPLSVKHFCYYTIREYDFYKEKYVYILCEVVEETYPHPQLPDGAILTKLDTRFVEVLETDDVEATAMLLYNQEIVTNSIVKSNTKE